MRKVAGLGAVLAVMALLGLHAVAQSKLPPQGTAGIDWSKAVRVTVVMSEYEFSPGRIVLPHDTPTRLHLVNRSESIHDFTAAHFFQTVDLKDPGVMGASGIGVTVEPQQQKDVDLVPRLRGHFGLICADHDWAGMTADILVE